MIKVIRFSNSGFDGQYQKHYKEQVDFLFSFKPEQLPKNLTPHTVFLITGGVESSRKRLNPSFHFFGIHVFFEPATFENINLYLNHLSAKPPQIIRELPEKTPAYGLDSPYLQEISTLERLYNKGETGAYIPMGEAKCFGY